jgi:hypothetical protein
MNKPNLKPAPVKPVAPLKPTLAKEKAKAVAFVNWAIPSSTDPTKYALRSTKGFSLFNNEYLTLEEKALIELAHKNGGSVEVNAVLRIVIHVEKPESLDISNISIIK